MGLIKVRLYVVSICLMKFITKVIWIWNLSFFSYLFFLRCAKGHFFILFFTSVTWYSSLKVESKYIYCIWSHVVLCFVFQLDGNTSIPHVASACAFVLLCHHRLLFTLTFQCHFVNSHNAIDGGWHWILKKKINK